MAEAHSPSTNRCDNAASLIRRPTISERRRRLPRQAAHRVARYRLEGDRGLDWQECRVLDLSLLGAGLEISEIAGREVLGRSILVEVQTASPLTGSLKTTQFAGVIRDARAEPGRAVRVGVQFVGDLSWSERALIDAYDRMRIPW